MFFVETHHPIWEADEKNEAQLKVLAVLNRTLSKCQGIQLKTLTMKISLLPTHPSDPGIDYVFHVIIAHKTNSNIASFSLDVHVGGEALLLKHPMFNNILSEEDVLRALSTDSLVSV